MAEARMRAWRFGGRRMAAVPARDWRVAFVDVERGESGLTHIPLDQECWETDIKTFVEEEYAAGRYDHKDDPALRASLCQFAKRNA